MAVNIVCYQSVTKRRSSTSSIIGRHGLFALLKATFNKSTPNNPSSKYFFTSLDNFSVPAHAACGADARHVYSNCQTQLMTVLCALFFVVFIPLLLAIADVFSERVRILPTTLIASPIWYTVILEALIVGHFVKKYILRTPRFFTTLWKACLLFISFYFVFMS